MRASRAAEEAAAAAHREAVEKKLDRQTKTAAPVPEDRPRCAHFSFCGREGDVRYSRLGANVQDTDDIFVSACFIAANNHGLFGIELDKALEQVGQLHTGEGSSIYDDVAVGPNVDDDVTDRSALFFCGRRFRHFDVELVFISSCIPRQQKENQKQQQDIDQGRELNARVLERRVTTQVHESTMSILRRGLRL